MRNEGKLNSLSAWMAFLQIVFNEEFSPIVNNLGTKVRINFETANKIATLL